MTTKNLITHPKSCFMSANNWDIVGGGVFGYQCVWVNRNNRVFDELNFTLLIQLKIGSPQS